MRSDLTATSGRFWTPEAPWNRDVVLHDIDQDATDALSLAWLGGLAITWAVDAHSPSVSYLGPTAVQRVLPGGSEKVWLPPTHEDRPWQVVVDLHQRTVLSIDRWEADDGATHVWHQATSLDSEGWGSTAVGLILEREILNLRIPHAVGIAGPAEFYGRRVAGPHWLARRGGAPAERALITALCTYGGVFTSVCDERIMVICEHSGSAIAGDQAGLHYRHLGIREDAQAVGISPADLAVLV